ncbi:hypothetical protein H632_c1535p0, partial [Helicosporidium sp. ATCC 50920]
MERLWEGARDHVAFCVGDDQGLAEHLLAVSFPWPLPLGPSQDPICGRAEFMEPFLCSPAEIMTYAKYMLMTDNPEKIPDTSDCVSGHLSSACAPGFFDARLGNRRPGRPRNPPEPHACCAGYFCPSQLTCMMPCPRGAYCPPAHPMLPPEPYRNLLDGGDEDAGRLEAAASSSNAAMWCAPYAYKQWSNLTCGGADKWAIVPPEKAFPASKEWEGGSGSLFCPGGFFCPTTTSLELCPRGSSCRQGSWEPTRCPPGAFCPPGTDVPSDDVTGVTVDALLAALLCLLWYLSRATDALLRRLADGERLAARWEAGSWLPVVELRHGPPLRQSSLAPLFEEEPLALRGSGGALSGSLNGGWDPTLSSLREPEGSCNRPGWNRLPAARPAGASMEFRCLTARLPGGATI